MIVGLMSNIGGLTSNLFESLCVEHKRFYDPLTSSV